MVRENLQFFLAMKRWQSVKTYIISMSILLLSFSGIKAQTFIQRNVSGTSTTSSQFGATSAKRTQQLYTPADLGNPIDIGNIEEIYFQYGTTTAQSFTDLEIYIGQTTNTALTSDLSANFSSAGMTPVFGAASFTIPAGTAGDWFAIPLTNPFLNYDPTKSIVVETRWNTNPTNTSWAIRYGAADATNTNRKYVASTSTGATGTVSTLRANFRFKLLPSLANDAGIVSIDAPVSPAPPGSNAVVVTLKNHGAAPLTSTQINWSVDGAPQTPYAWSGSLASGSTTSVVVGTFNFSSGSHNIVVRSNLPNNAADGNPANDEAVKTVVFCAPVSGTVQVNSAFPVSDPALGQFKSFTDLAAQLAACGISGDVTVNVVTASGPYNEQVTFSTIPGVGPGARVTINGNGNTVAFATTSTDRHIIRLADVSYMTINNLNLLSSGAISTTSTMAVHIYNTGSNIVVNNCTIDLTGITTTLAGGVVSSGGITSILTAGNFSNITVSNNTITGGGYGVSFYGTNNTGLDINNNTIYDFSSNGIYMRGTNGAMVRSNVLNKRAGSVGGNAIQVAQTDNTNTTIHSNKISMEQTTGGFVGIYLFGGTGHKVYNNLIYDIRSATGAIEGIRVRQGAPEIYFNTISFDSTTTTSGSLRGIKEELSNTGAVIKNNIFSLTQSVAANNKVAIELASTSTLTTAITSNNNVFWVPGGSVGIRGATSYADKSAWNTATSQDGASFEADPFFQAAINPIPTSGIINSQATSISGITTDITGAARGANPDPGAYEFSPASNDAAITNFILPTLPHCGTTLAVQFELTNSGSVPLNTVNINWTVNGVAQAPYTYSGAPVAPGASVIVTLGTVPVTGNNSYAFTAIASSPNGATDANTSNDSYTYTGFRRGISGALTIDAGAPASATNYITFKSIADTLAKYGVCGPVTIDVMSGPYTEQVVFNNIPGTSASSRIILNGNNQELNFNPTNASSDHILQLNGVKYFTVQNLRVKSTHASNGRGIHLTNGASFIVLENNTVDVTTSNTSSTAFGIIASGANYLLDGTKSDSLKINGNTITGGYVGIQLTGETPNPGAIVDAVVSNNILQDQYLYGIQTSEVTNAVISTNEVTRRNRSGASGAFYGINLTYRSLNFRVEKNKIHNLQNATMTLSHLSGGIKVDGTNIAPSSGTIVNNVVYEITNTSTQYGINDATWGTGNTVNIYHNTIAMNDVAFTGSATTSAVYVSASGRPVGAVHSIKNNLFYISREGTGNKRLIDVADEVFTSNNNIFYFGTAAGTLQFGRSGGTNYADLTAWQATGNDANSVQSDPIFSNPGAGDFTPSSSLVDNIGAPLGVTTDIIGTVRDVNTPDAGAFEFGIPMPVTLLSFTGEKQGSSNRLQWITTTEANSAGFELERSVDGKNFSKLAFIASKGDNGNSSQNLTYQYFDERPLTGNNYYRLRQVDKDGKFMYSNVVLVKGNKVNEITITALYPNPVESDLNVVITSPVSEKVMIVVTDLAGRVINVGNMQVNSGDNVYKLSVASLARGTYFIKTACSSGCESQVQKFVKQ